MYARSKSSNAHLHALLVFGVGCASLVELDEVGTAVPVISSSVMASCVGTIVFAIVFGRFCRAFAALMGFARCLNPTRIDHGLELEAGFTAQRNRRSDSF